MEAALGYPLFTDGPERLGWLMNLNAVRALCRTQLDSSSHDVCGRGRFLLLGQTVRETNAGLCSAEVGNSFSRIFGWLHSFLGRRSSCIC